MIGMQITVLKGYYGIKKCFRHYTYAKIATDGFFQQSNLYSGSIDMGKVY